MSVIRAIISGFARDGGATGAFLRNSENLDGLVAALRRGAVKDFLAGAKDGAALAKDPLFMRTMAKLGDNLQYLDNVEAGLAAGRRIDNAEFLRGLGVDASDNIAAGLTRGLARYNEAVRAGAQQGSNVDDLLAQADRALDRGAGAVKPKPTPKPRMTEADYQARSARTGLKHYVYGKLNTTADWLQERGVLGRVASGGLRVTAGTVRWGLPVFGMAAAGVVGMNWVTDGASTRALADAANASAVWTADAIKDTWPEAAKLLRDLGPDAADFMLGVMSAPVDTAGQFIKETAEYHGIKLPPEQVRAFAQFMSGNPLMAALTASGHEIDPRDAIKLYKDARDKPDPQAYIRQQLQQKFNLSDDQMQEVVDRAEDLRGTAGTARDRLAHYRQDLGEIQTLTGSGLTARFNEVVQNQHLSMFSSFNMFLATVLGFLGLDSIADQFKRAVVVDATISQYGDKFNLTGGAPRLAAATPAPNPGEPAPA